ncbi:MAG: OmpH family outer membrane protein [Rhodanobacter sp.]
MNQYRCLLVASLVAVAGFSVALMNSARAADTNGNPVPGVCVLSREAVYANAKVGQAATERLQQLGEQVRTQMASERKPLDADIQSFQQKQSSMSDAQRKQQGSALQDRMQMLQAQADAVNQRIQLTRDKAVQRIGQEAQPIVASSYAAHHCGLLLNRDVVLAGNMTNDLTAEVVQGLDRKITTISFNLESLPSSTQKQK